MSEQEIIDFFLEREKQYGKERNSALKSYDIIKSLCASNFRKFSFSLPKTP